MCWPNPLQACVIALFLWSLLFVFYNEQCYLQFTVNSLCFLHLIPLSSCTGHSFLFCLSVSVLLSDLTSRPRSPPQPPPPPLPPGRPPPPTPPQDRGSETEAAGGGGASSGAEECEERDRDPPLLQLEGVEGEEREGGRARAIDNQYSFF